MKRVLVTLVLALITAAWGQGSSTPAAQQPAAQQPAASGDQANVPTSQKVIKDPTEYNAYIAALNLTDPAAKGAAMEAFVTQYPSSIVKIDALQQSMSAYQQASNQAKAEQIANQILAIDSDYVPALEVIVFVERGKINNAATGAKARGDAERGLKDLSSWKAPEGTSAADFEKMHNQMENIFAGTAAFGALQQQDYPSAEKYYAEALKTDPNDLANNYQMGIARLQSNPMDPLGFWYGAKALSIAQGANNQQAAASMSPYFVTRYKKYHGNADDWNQRVAAAATQTVPPADFVASIPLAPTPCDLAAQVAQQNAATDLSFSDWELVLSCRDKTPANKAAAEKIWTEVQAKEKNGEAKLKIPVKVISSADASSLDVALSDDNQKDNKADMHVALEKPMVKPPAPGAMIDIIGVISEYTPDPFMFTMTKGELPVPKPASKAPAKKGVATKKKAQ